MATSRLLWVRHSVQVIHCFGIFHTTLRGDHHFKTSVLSFRLATLWRVLFANSSQVSGTVQSASLCDTASTNPRRMLRAKSSSQSTRVRSTSWDGSRPGHCTTRSWSGEHRHCLSVCVCVRVCARNKWMNQLMNEWILSLCHFQIRLGHYKNIKL